MNSSDDIVERAAQALYRKNWATLPEARKVARAAINAIDMDSIVAAAVQAQKEKDAAIARGWLDALWDNVVAHRWEAVMSDVAEAIEGQE